MARSDLYALRNTLNLIHSAGRCRDIVVLYSENTNTNVTVTYFNTIIAMGAISYFESSFGS